MKRCGHCGEIKALTDFHRWRNGRQPWCKGCRRAYDHEYFQRTRPARLAQKRRRHDELIRWYRSLKEGKPCMDCGGVFHHAAMAWDHLPGQDKCGEVSNLVRKQHSKRSVLAEIAKCELVCANCHAVRSFERLRGVAQPG